MSRLLATLRQRRFLLLLPLLLVALAGTPAKQTSAHPLGNFTVNQYVRVEVLESGPRLVYVLDLAEIPTFQLMQSIDANGDGALDQTESAAYLGEVLPQIANALDLSVGGDVLTLRSEQSSFELLDGQAGLKISRLRATFVPQAPLLLTGGDQQIALENTYQTDRLGWREIVVTNGEGVILQGIDVPASDLSRELTSYPSDLLQSPLDQTTVAFGVRKVAGAPAAASFAAFSAGVAQPSDAAAARPNGGSTGGKFAALLDRDDLSRTGMLLALLAAMAWGAMHALSPGHGKTVVGAYLVGSKGTPRHAIFLGLTVTITHTAGVIALGLVTLFASHYIVPETIFPWLSVGSGALVVAMGLWTTQMRLRGVPIGHHHHDHAHDHEHHHEHDHGHENHHHHHVEPHTHSHGGHTHSHTPPSDITWRSLLALGVSGGLIPCPSALLVLLGSVALGRVGFGLALVVAFSLGLAATLTGLGMLFLYAGRVFERRVGAGGRLQTLLRYAPALGSFALTLAGIAIIVRALGETSLR
jgi:ABC-type nickel/cobalt efflux system permease component RcnA